MHHKSPILIAFIFLLCSCKKDKTKIPQELQGRWAHLYSVAYETNADTLEQKDDFVMEISEDHLRVSAKSKPILDEKCRTSQAMAGSYQLYYGEKNKENRKRKTFSAEPHGETLTVHSFFPHVSTNDTDPVNGVEYVNYFVRE